MKQAQKMQSQMAGVQQELESEIIETSAGGGAVKVVANGKQEIKEIKIDPSAMDPSDPQILEDMILIAVNDALSQAADLANKKLGQVTGGLSLPGLF
jgi:hypothetical protein